MRSDRIKKGLERVPHRALLYATGLTKEEMERPFIGIATSFNDLVPGHIGMRTLERFIEKGVHTGGGHSFFFGVPAICDGIAMGHTGMHYSLPSRELIADMIESVTMAHALDGLVLLTNCDKVTPGMLMAAARLDVPSIIVTAGPMHTGMYKMKRRSFVRDTYEAIGRFKNKEITEEELSDLEVCACPGGGSCQGMYTANTMACVTESLGMSLVGCATGLEGSADKRRIAFDSGVRIVGMVEEDLTPRKIMTKDAFENAIRIDMALGGSTNTALHIPAIAHEAGIELPLELFDVISRETPNIVKLEPAGDYFMEDLEYAGGIPAVMNRLKKSLKDNITVSKKNIKEIAESANVIDSDVIRTKENAYYQKKTQLAHPMRQLHNFIKSDIIYTYCHPMYQNNKQLSVLDIACGRGGDTLKFYYAMVAFYVGIDIDKEGLISAVDGAISRYNQFRKKHPNFPKMYFIQADATALLNTESQKNALNVRKL